MKKSNYNYKLSILQNCDGSSSFKINDSTVLIGFYGPLEAKQSREIVDRAYIDVLYKAKIGLGTEKHKFYESFIHDICSKSIILNKHPRTQLNIIIQEIIDSKSMLSCIINGVCLALLDAGIELYFSFAAVTCYINSNDEIFVTPHNNIDSVAEVTFVFENTKFKNVAIHQIGIIAHETLTVCRKAARKESKKLFLIQRKLFESKSEI